MFLIDEDDGRVYFKIANAEHNYPGEIIDIKIAGNFYIILITNDRTIISPIDKTIIGTKFFKNKIVVNNTINDVIPSLLNDKGENPETNDIISEISKQLK